MWNCLFRLKVRPIYESKTNSFEGYGSFRTYYTTKIEIYRRCFAVLGVSEKADQNTVRRAYIDLVKKVHPDSGHPEASAEKFQEIDEAFKILQEKYAKNRRGIDDDEVKVFDIRHTAPQHRQYLSYDGVGLGNPSQRQKQFQQVKAVRAQERVMNHRIQKAQAGEMSLMKKGQHERNHDIRTRYGFDRVVEDLIQEAMSKGDFNNLSGAGKPLSEAQTQNPYLDFTTHKLNKILLDNGFQPEWISLQRQIREDVEILRKALERNRSHLGDVPLNEEDEMKWQLMVKNYQQEADRINQKIDKYNLIVPLLNNQMLRIQLHQLADSVLKDDSILTNIPKEPDTQINAQRNQDDIKSNFLSFLSSLF